jgi:tricorn protease
VGRDWFYDANMHGLVWDALRGRYGQLVQHAAHRSDLDFILGELGGELCASHTYTQSGDAPGVERIEGAMLGCEFVADASGYYRFSKIFEGENWDETYRSPLTIPGIEISEGDYLIAIDGLTVKTTDNPYRFLEGKGHTTVLVTVNDRPSDRDSRSYRVRPVTSEGPLRYLNWVRERMRMAEKLSGGRVGYIHLPNTAGTGNRMLQKLFYSQTDKDALIIDDRYNGGGFIPDRMIEMLTRKTMVYWTRRDVTSMRTPGFAHDGPKAMLINPYAASGGDALPYFFRQAGLGPIVGTRTWGGLVGISGNPMGVDGGGILFPMFRMYSTGGNWVVENEGVAPDIEVYDLPEAILEGHDPSLEAAVEFLLRELAESAPTRPKEPTPPNLAP